jgi:putative hydrolases of HD superfamily
VAEHLFHTAMIAYTLCYLEPKADKAKVVLMALFHDIGEGRTSDLNYIHQRYGRLSEDTAVADIARDLPFGPEIASLYREEQARETLEAKLVKDADSLEWICTLREEEVKGNKKATSWLYHAPKRLKTPIGKKLAHLLLTTHPDAWWFNINDKWFLERKKSQQSWHASQKKPKKAKR